MLILLITKKGEEKMDWNEILVFIQKWWLEFVLGGAGIGLSIMARYFYKQMKKAKEIENQEKKAAFKEELTNEVKLLVKTVHEEVKAEIEAESKQVREEMAEYETNDGERITALENRSDILEDTLSAVVDNLDKIKEGLLAVQGHEFRNKCRRLLQMEYIKPEDYEQLESDHRAYNNLGGNHKGDSLFDQVKTKYYSQLQQQ